MATKQSARKRTASRSSVNPDQFSFETSNEPNADILLASLRSAGYNLESVVGDLIDNCIDAQSSSVVVNLAISPATGEWELEVGDDGFGMDEPVLDQMMRLGSRSDHDLDADLGAFGLGSDTAALAIGRNKHVVTCSEPSVYLSSMWDLDAIKEARKFVKHLDVAGKDEVALFTEAFERSGIEPPPTGTVVRITKGDRVGRKEVDAAARAVRKYVGQTYRRFLVPNGGLTIIVNGEAVDPFDPMMRDDPDTMVLLDDRVDFTWRDRRGETHTEKLGFLIVHLPDKGGAEANKDAGITIDGSGFYLMRNGREIVAGSTLRLFTRHNEYSRFRVELTFPATLDAQMGVTFLKSSSDIKPAQGLKDKIREVTAPYRRQSLQALTAARARTRTSRSRTTRPLSRSRPGRRSSASRRPRSRSASRGSRVPIGRAPTPRSRRARACRARRHSGRLPTRPGSRRSTWASTRPSTRGTWTAERSWWSGTPTTPRTSGSSSTTETTAGRSPRSTSWSGRSSPRSSATSTTTAPASWSGCAKTRRSTSASC